MKEITYFYLKNCPFCRQADQMIQELVAQETKFSAIPINKIEEREQADLANQYDYYFVPCLYIGKAKMMEGVSTLKKIREAFLAALD